jgi:hypothetical protein
VPIYGYARVSTLDHDLSIQQRPEGGRLQRRSSRVLRRPDDRQSA